MKTREERNGRQKDNAAVIGLRKSGLGSSVDARVVEEELKKAQTRAEKMDELTLFIHS